MSYDVYMKGKKADHVSFGATMGMTAELQDNTVRGLGMQGALRRFAKQLLKQYEGQTMRDSKLQVVGVRMSSVTVQFILQRQDPRATPMSARPHVRVRTVSKPERKGKR
jgi:hypothetical protein